MFKLQSILICLVMTAALAAEECVCLPSPNFSKCCFKGYREGAFADRAGGVNLKSETVGGKLLIHNYGHGRNGHSIAWGSAQVVASYIPIEDKQPVAIIGAGANGLSVANVLLDRGYPVTVYASCYPPNTASNISPYLWQPMKAPRDDQKDLYKKINEASYLHFRDLTASDSPEYQGVKMMPVYTFGASEGMKTQHKDAKDVSVTFCSGRTYQGFRWCTIAIDTDLYLCDLFAKAQQKGAFFVPRTIKNKGDLLSLKETIIINCSGMGAVDVSGDTTVIPVCGKFMIFEPQPKIEYAAEVYDGDTRLFYYVPGYKRLSLGEITVKGDKKCDVDEVKGHQLVESANNFFAFP